MKDMILFPEDIDRLNSVLSQLVSKANLLLAVLINKDGRLLTNQGSLELVDTVSMAALIAGNSASTLAIANLMGETEFSTMYHQGKNKHIYISVVDDNTFLALVFDDRTNIDRVKVFARQFDRQLKQSLLQVYDKSEDQIVLDLDMGFDQFANNQQSQQNGQNSFMDNQNFFSAPPDQRNYFDSNIPQQQPANVSNQNIQAVPPPVNVNNTQMPSDNAPTARGTLRNTQDEEEVFYIESMKNGQKSPEVDTNYLYLQKKIRETVKRKKDE